MRRMIKRCLLALLFVSMPGWSQVEQFHSFTMGDATYSLIPSSMRMENRQLVALWNVATPNYSWRWRVTISGCDKPYGTIQTKMERTERIDDWSMEGVRAYDYMASYTCVSYVLKEKK